MVNGGAGFDTLDFRGANTGENIMISANDSGALFSRITSAGTGAVTEDLDGVERIQFETVGHNEDHVTINDLTGTDVKQVAIDLGVGADTITIDAQTGTGLKQFAIDLGTDDGDQVEIRRMASRCARLRSRDRS